MVEKTPDFEKNHRKALSSEIELAESRRVVREDIDNNEILIREAADEEMREEHVELAEQLEAQALEELREWIGDDAADKIVKRIEINRHIKEVCNKVGLSPRMIQRRISAMNEIRSKLGLITGDEESDMDLVANMYMEDTRDSLLGIFEAENEINRK